MIIGQKNTRRRTLRGADTKKLSVFILDDCELEIHSATTIQVMYTTQKDRN